MHVLSTMPRFLEDVMSPSPTARTRTSGLYTLWQPHELTGVSGHMVEALG